jgi:hypothetical protein
MGDFLTSEYRRRGLALRVGEVPVKLGPVSGRGDLLGL